MSEAELSTISLTPNAIARIHALMLRSNNFDQIFRVYIMGGGCSGFQYGFRFDEKPQDDDWTFEQKEEGHSVQIAIDPMSYTYLEGAKVDFVQSLQGAFFKVENPNALTTCGCGASFSIE